MTTTNCVFDWCALWNGLGLGVLASLVASGLIYCIIRWRDRRIYGTAEGEYKGYEYEKSELVKNGQVEVAELRGLNRTKATSTARIKYNYVNVLEITVQSTDGNSVWCGTITMQEREFWRSGMAVCNPSQRRASFWIQEVFGQRRRRHRLGLLAW